MYFSWWLLFRWLYLVYNMSATNSEFWIHMSSFSQVFFCLFYGPFLERLLRKSIEKHCKFRGETNLQEGSKGTKKTKGDFVSHVLIFAKAYVIWRVVQSIYYVSSHSIWVIMQCTLNYLESNWKTRRPQSKANSIWKTKIDMEPWEKTNAYYIMLKSNSHSFFAIVAKSSMNLTIVAT